MKRVKPMNRSFALVTSVLLGLSLTAASTERMSPSAPASPPSGEGPPAMRGAPSRSAPAPDRGVPESQELTRRKLPASGDRERAIRMRRQGGDIGSTDALLRSLNARALADQKAAIDAENAKVRAELAKLRGAGVPAASPRLDAIRQEATAIQDRQATASAEQKAKDAARIDLLYAEYERLAR